MYPYFPLFNDIITTPAFNFSVSVENILLFDEVKKVFPGCWYSDHEDLIRLMFLNILFDLMGALICKGIPREIWIIIASGGILDQKFGKYMLINHLNLIVTNLTKT